MGDYRGPHAPRLPRPARWTIRRLGAVVSIAMAGCATTMVATIGLLEWHIATHGLPAGAAPGSTILAAVAAPGAVIALFLVATPAVLVVSMRTKLDPLVALAGCARLIASGQSVQIAYTDRDDLAGDLARALRDWQDGAVVSEVLLRSAPVGIIWLDGQTVREANPAALATLGYAKDELTGHDVMELTHPDDRHVAAQLTPEALAAAGVDRAVVEIRLRRSDGRWLWCSAVVAPVNLPEEEQPGFVVILEDISERKRQSRWAAAVQREMLPGHVPELEGYEVAASFLPAEEVAGDLYDWVERGNGRLDLTVADVMGKGMGAALVMAVLRTALRAAPAELGPAERVARAAEAVTFGSAGDDLLVTLFQGRLEAGTGRLRYVDAGHGYCVVRRAGGEIERLGARSLPLGLGLGDEFAEGEVELRPGDMLLVCSDGLMEAGEETARLDEVAGELAGVEGADEVVTRLVGRMSGRLTDDATVLVVHRLAEAAVLPAPPSSRARTPLEPPARPAPPTAAPPVPGDRPAVRVADQVTGSAFLRFALEPSNGGAVLALVVLSGLVAFAEWRLGTSVPGVESRQASSTILLAVAVPIAVGLPLATLITLLGEWTARLSVLPVPMLGRCARRIASGERTRIPFTGRDDEIGDLARALRDWQDAAAIRETLVRSAPVGIFRIDQAGVVGDSNQAVWTMLGRDRDELDGVNLMELVHPDDRHLAARVREALGGPVTLDVRLRRRDGSWLWCSAVVAPFSLPDGERPGFMVILGDISERKRQDLWAAAVQREMMPSHVPELEGYELAASFLPAQEVASDLYDWVERGDGRLDLTVADVMGKGMGAALVIAALRTALRTAPAELGPADRVARAAENMTFGSDGGGQFVTLFQGRLEARTGRLRYVDAGHGHCVLRRAGGAIERLGQRSLPLGVAEEFVEGEVELEPGDMLLVGSDGLMELGEDTARLEEVVAGLDVGDDAAAVVGRLVGRVQARRSDDATIVVLRRLAPVPAASATHV